MEITRENRSRVQTFLYQNEIMQNDTIFPQVLFLSCITSIYLQKEDFKFMSFIIFSHILCMINLFVQNKTFQLLLHDVFVYSLLYSNLQSSSIKIRAYGAALCLIMCITRMYYNKCMFLYWNNERNTDFDICVWLILMFNIFNITNCLKTR